MRKTAPAVLLTLCALCGTAAPMLALRETGYEVATLLAALDVDGLLATGIQRLMESMHPAGAAVPVSAATAR